MRNENRSVIAFITVLALVFTTFLPTGASFATGTGDETSGLLMAPSPISEETLIAATPVPAAPTSGLRSSFRDVSGHWAESAINDAVVSGFVKGYSDGSFKPDRAVTRAEFVTMINKALQLRDENTVNLLFNDVKATDWFYNDIRKASYARYVSGVSDTSFMPARTISRQEAAAMLSRFLPNAAFMEELPAGVPAGTQLSSFPDSDKVSTWARAALAVVINKGYMSGHANGNLAPQGTLTRAEAATIIGKILSHETIVREDVYVANSGDILQGNIYVGDITIEKSVGEGEATLDNLSALSRVIVQGGGMNTVTIKDAIIIQLIVSKEGTKVRVLSNGDSTIFEAFVFNGNIVVDETGSGSDPGDAGYENIVYIDGTVSAADAVRIAREITSRMDNSGRITQKQVAEGAAAVLTGITTTLNPDGSIAITVGTPETIGGGGGSDGGGGGAIMIETLYGTAELSEIRTSDEEYCGHDSTTQAGFTELVTFDDGSTAYAISTPAQLQHLAMHLDSNAVLLQDIAFSTTTGPVNGTPMGALSEAAGTSLSALRIEDFTEGNFVPIGYTVTSAGITMPDHELVITSTVPFTGTFYGNSKSISGLNINASTMNYVGLFAAISGAVIQDLKVTEGGITGGGYVGGVVGSSNNSIIKEVYNAQDITGPEAGYVGGVVGYSDGGSVNYCYNIGTVTKGVYVGGVVGYITDGIVSNSSNTGNVSGKNYVGGVVGVTTHAEATTEIISCFSTGIVAGEKCIGGVVGVNGDDSSVSDSYNTGAVSGTGEIIGGIIGQNNGTLSNSYNSGAVTGGNYVGGVAGSSDYSTLSSVNNTGSVNGVNNVGGVAGIIYDTTLSDAYNTGSVSGVKFIAGIAGEAKFSMITKSYNTGNIKATDICVGGLVGYSGGSTLSTVYNMGSVTGLNRVGGVVGNNGTDSNVHDSFNSGVVNGSEHSAGGIIGDNYQATVMDSYNTGAVTGNYSVGGGIGDNAIGSLATATNLYNTGAVTGAGTGIGGVIGNNNSYGIVTNSSWLNGTNLINSKGIDENDNGQTSTAFSANDETLAAIYASMAAIATSAGGISNGAITGISFSDAVNTTSFSGLQGSYIKTDADVGLTITAISAASITVATAASLNALISPGGTDVQATASVDGVSTYNVVGNCGTWALIKAISSDYNLNRSYIIYFAKATISTATIAGITAPVRGATPAAVATETDEYTANISWSGSPVTFAADTIYTATITITPKDGYTLTGVAENFFSVAGTSVAATNDANTGVVTAVFPKTSKAPISIAAIAGITAPVRGANPAAIATETDEYTATISWSDSPSTFVADTTYTAIITITPKAGYTLTGVAENFFIVAGTSEAATNDANAGVVTAVFPKTAKTPLSAATVTIVAPAAGSTPQTASDIQTATNDANFTITSVTWNQGLTTGSKFKAAQAYTATIVLTSKNLMEFQAAAFTPVVSGSASVGTTTTSGSGVGNTVSFTVTYAATAALSANSIAVKTQPTDLEYAEDDALSLAGLSVTLTYNDGTTEDVAFAGFGAKSITVNFADGLAMLVATHNGNPVIVTCNSHTANTSNLSVTAPAVGICGHLVREGGFISSTTIYGELYYEISTAAQLQHLAMHTSASAILMNDITFGSTKGAEAGTAMLALSQAAIDCSTDLRIPDFVAGNFVPIGTKASPFTGSFDGNNKSISGLNITASAISYVGLFGYASGAFIQNLNISGGSITGQESVGSVVGKMLEGEVKNIHNTAAVTGFGDYVGGVVGYGEWSDIYYCKNAGAVNGSGLYTWFVGGVVGLATKDSRVYYSSNTGAIVGQYDVGGIVGLAEKLSDIVFINNTGVVTGLATQSSIYDGGIGGIAGDIEDSILSQGYNTGAVNGTTNVGGLVGYSSHLYIGADTKESYNTGAVSGITNVGGLVGFNYLGRVTDSQNSGVVTGTTNVGGIVGINDWFTAPTGGVVTNCQWLEGTNLNTPSGIGYDTHSQTTTTFSAIDGNLSDIYTSMSTITTCAGETTVGAITAITFNGTVNTSSFDALQGSYITSGAGNGFTVTVIPGTALTVTRATSLETLVSPGGTNVQATSSSGNASTFSIAGVSGNWIMIKAVNEADPSTNRTYIVYIRTLGGTVSISGTLKFNEILTAVTTVGVSTNIIEASTLTYTWKRGSTTVGSNQATYTTAADDIGQTISCEVTISVEAGTITGTASGAIAKADVSPPNAPVVAATYRDMIVLEENVSCEFRIDSGDWVTNTWFSNLTPNSTYTFYSRYKGTATTNASESSLPRQAMTLLFFM